MCCSELPPLPADVLKECEEKEAERLEDLGDATPEDEEVRGRGAGRAGRAGAVDGARTAVGAVACPRAPWRVLRAEERRGEAGASAGCRTDQRPGVWEEAC